MNAICIRRATGFTRFFGVNFTYELFQRIYFTLLFINSLELIFIPLSIFTNSENNEVCPWLLYCERLLGERDQLSR